MKPHMKYRASTILLFLFLEQEVSFPLFASSTCKTFPFPSKRVPYAKEQSICRTRYLNTREKDAKNVTVQSSSVLPLVHRLFYEVLHSLFVFSPEQRSGRFIDRFQVRKQSLKQ